MKTVSLKPEEIGPHADDPKVNEFNSSTHRRNSLSAPIKVRLRLLLFRPAEGTCSLAFLAKLRPAERGSTLTLR